MTLVASFTLKGPDKNGFQKNSFLIIGKNTWNSEMPGPVNLDLDQLNSVYINQLAYAVANGTLVTDKLPELRDKFNEVVLGKTEGELKPPVISPKQQAQNLIQEAFKNRQEERKTFLHILDQNAVSVKKNLFNYSDIGSLKRILLLEKSNRNRESIIRFIEELIQDQSSEVLTLTNQVTEFNPYDLEKLKPLDSNVSDIIEEDQEEIVIKLE